MLWGCKERESLCWSTYGQDDPAVTPFYVSSISISRTYFLIGVQLRVSQWQGLTGNLEGYSEVEAIVWRTLWQPNVAASQTSPWAPTVQGSARHRGSFPSPGALISPSTPMSQAPVISDCVSDILASKPSHLDFSHHHGTRSIHVGNSFPIIYVMTLFSWLIPFPFLFFFPFCGKLNMAIFSTPAIERESLILLSLNMDWPWWQQIQLYPAETAVRLKRQIWQYMWVTHTQGWAPAWIWRVLLCTGYYG